MKIDARARKVSITSDMFDYSFKPEIERKLRLFAEYGFEYISWGDDYYSEVLYTKQNIELYRQLIESYGLKCIDVHGAETETILIDAEEEDALNKYIQLLENRVQFCSAIGGDSVVIHTPSDKDTRALSLRIDRSLQVFDSVRPLCEDLGIVIAVENSYPLDEKILEYYLERYPPEFVGFCFDSGHAHLYKNLDQVLKFNDRLKALHLHDNRGKEDAHQPPFWGTTDWERVMRWIKWSGYTKPINFEITHYPKFFEGTMEEFLDHTVRSIRKTLGLIRRLP
jgi:sugar phosphate isomerase/epimerase